MTPKPPDSPKESKHRLVHFKHNNRPRHKAIPHRKPSDLRVMRPPHPHCSASVSNVKPPENYENLLLFYLNKLKSLFSNPFPQPASRENSALKMGKLHKEHYLRSSHQRASSLIPPATYTSSNPPRPREEEVKAKVYKVVSAAINYGFANNVLERKGDYFTFRTLRPRVFHRAPTPGPRYCQRCCSRCVKESPYRCSADRNRFCDDCMPLHGIASGRVDREYRNCPVHHGHFLRSHEQRSGHHQDDERHHAHLKTNVTSSPEYRKQ